MSSVRCRILAAAADELQETIWVVDMQPVPSIWQRMNPERALARTRCSLLLRLAQFVLQVLRPPAGVRTGLLMRTVVTMSEAGSVSDGHCAQSTWRAPV